MKQPRRHPKAKGLAQKRLRIRMYKAFSLDCIALPKRRALPYAVMFRAFNPTAM